MPTKAAQTRIEQLEKEIERQRRRRKFFEGLDPSLIVRQRGLAMVDRTIKAKEAEIRRLQKK